MRSAPFLVCMIWAVAHELPTCESPAIIRVAMLASMKRLLVATSAVLLLAGCDATPAPAETASPKPKATVAPNAIACKKFEAHITRVADLVVELWGD